jgi:hypothetical protein
VAGDLPVAPSTAERMTEWHEFHRREPEASA